MRAVPWSEVPEDQLIQGIRRRIVTGERVMLGRIFFPQGARVPAHSHESEQITHVLRGTLLFVVAGQEAVVRAGETLHIPSNVEHSAEALEETDEISAFSPIRPNWLDGSVEVSPLLSLASDPSGKSHSTGSGSLYCNTECHGSPTP